MPEPPSAQELITGCIEGKKESWDFFVDRFSRLIYWSIWRALKSSGFAGGTDLAREIFQEVFQKLLEKNELKKLRQIESVKKFLVVMAGRAAQDKIKSLGRQERRLGDLRALGNPEPSHQAVSHERDLLISQVIGELSPKEQLCVEWHYADDKTHREISEALGLSQDTVSTVIRRAKEKIRKNFLEKGILE